MAFFIICVLAFSFVLRVGDLRMIFSKSAVGDFRSPKMDLFIRKLFAGMLNIRSSFDVYNFERNCILGCVYIV